MFRKSESGSPQIHTKVHIISFSSTIQLNTTLLRHVLKNLFGITNAPEVVIKVLELKFMVLTT